MNETEAIRTRTTYIPIKLFGLTGSRIVSNLSIIHDERDAPANINPIHTIPSTGRQTLTVLAKWWTNTLSNIGAERMAATNPLNRNIPPINPLTIALYPYGWNICAMKTEKLEVPAMSTPKTKKRMKKSRRSVVVRNCSPGLARPNAARNVWDRGGDMREPEYVGGLGGCASTKKESGKATLVMMARMRIPKRTSVKNGAII